MRRFLMRILCERDSTRPWSVFEVVSAISWKCGIFVAATVVASGLRLCVRCLEVGANVTR
jgi:hypothetical protein